MDLFTTILSVSEVTRSIKNVLESRFGNIAVEGEISNCKRHSSGHCYFTLKDEKAQLQSVMWRSRVEGLYFTPQDGMKVIARGNVSVYEPRGIYQLDVLTLQPAGLGELQLAFEKLKQKLSIEGLFDPGRKRPIPRFPRRIGVVTSPSGAALKDIVNVLARRCPSVELILSPARVQGAGASQEIATAIRNLNEYGALDVLIVGRGGGSLEDLWAFNEEIVARAIVDSSIPVISAVGHEVDFTISDFVADLRAPTPSAAAEIVVCTHRELIEIVSNYCYTAEQHVRDSLDYRRERIKTILQSYSFNRPIDLLRASFQRTSELAQSLERMVAHRVMMVRHQLVALDKRIQSVNPKTVLERGYAIVLRGGVAIRRASQLRPADEVDLKLIDGVAPATIQVSKKLEG